MRPRARLLMRSGGEQVARSAPRRLILGALPAAIPRQFAPDAADGLEATFELRVRGPDGGATTCYELRVADRRCDVRPGPADDPGATVTVGADDLVRLVSGAAAWPDLLASGRLEMSGDPFLALRFPMLFRLRAATG